MLVFIRQNLVLLATPKTGSTALHMALAPHADMVFKNLPQVKHIGLQRYQRFIKPLIAHYTDRAPESCALIREPEDWLGSWYRYRGRADLAGTARSTSGHSFEGFVDAYLSRPVPDWAAVGAQGRFLSNPRAGTQVDVLFRYEAMDRFVAWLSARLDMPIELPVVNTSPPARLELSDTTRARLHEKSARCYALHAQARH